jgi:alpha-L-fucosidase 2
MRLHKDDIIGPRSQQVALLIILLGWSGLPLQAQVHPERLPVPKPGLAQVDWRTHLSQDDLVYLSPPTEGWEGIPVGDGEAGTILWNPPDRLMFQVNHSGLWDDVPAGSRATEFCGSCKEGTRGTNKHAARIEIHPGLPLFDWKYLDDYEARLNLHDAQVELRSSGPLGTARLTMFESHPHRVLMVQYEDTTAEPAPRKVVLERFGSRSFGSWYSRLVQQPEIGLAGTASGHEGQEFWITKQLGSLSFAVAVHFEARAGDFSLAALNSFQCMAVSNPVRKAGFTLFLAVAHSNETRDPLALARQRVRSAAQDGLERVAARHRADWAHQWPMAFLDLPNDRYYQNLWSLIDYTNLSSRRGQEPPFFINSLWAWERDVQSWAGSYYHWNMWSPNFPLYPTGRLDLLKPYFQWKKRQLPHAVRFAREQHGLEGAFFTDFATRRGEQALSNASAKFWPISGPLIAQEFYKYWEITQDDRFLKEEALPFLRETARFLMNYSEEGEDGKIHLRPTVPYEFHGPYQFKDCITEMAMIRWLLPALMDAETRTGAVTALSARAKDFLARLAPINSGPIKKEWLTTQENRTVYGNPFFRGEPYLEKDQVFSTGWSTKLQKYVTHMDVSLDPASRYGVLCGAQVAPVWLAGLVGPDQSPERRDATGSNSPEEIRMWEMGRNGLRTMRMFPTIQPNPNQRTHADRFLSWTGHNQDLPAFARLGLKENLRLAMETYVEKYQITPQGFWNYWPWERWKGATVKPKGTKRGEEVPFPEDPRALHISLEPSGIFPVTLMESLMTSFDGVIRLFPAYDRDGGFRLAANGGFWVTARRSNGRTDLVQVESLAGKTCTVSNPWPEAQTVVIRLEDGRRMDVKKDRDRLQFATSKGTVYVLSPDGSLPAKWTVSGERRTSPHVWKVKLHTEPYYPIDAPGGFKTKVLGKVRDF